MNPPNVEPAEPTPATDVKPPAWVLGLPPRLLAENSEEFPKAATPKPDPPAAKEDGVFCALNPFGGWVVGGVEENGAAEDGLVDAPPGTANRNEGAPPLGWPNRLKSPEEDGVVAAAAAVAGARRAALVAAVVTATGLPAAGTGFWLVAGDPATEVSDIKKPCVQQENNV